MKKIVELLVKTSKTCPLCNSLRFRWGGDAGDYFSFPSQWADFVFKMGILEYICGNKCNVPMYSKTQIYFKKI